MYNKSIQEVTPMKALALYIAVTCIAVNVAGNWANGQANRIQEIQEQRTERLCQVNPIYC